MARSIRTAQFVPIARAHAGCTISSRREFSGGENGELEESGSLGFYWIGGDFVHEEAVSGRGSGDGRWVGGARVGVSAEVRKSAEIFA